jgi:hypothetical protein
MPWTLQDALNYAIACLGIVILVSLLCCQIFLWPDRPHHGRRHSPAEGDLEAAAIDD